jgi:hypothetical protein
MRKTFPVELSEELHKRLKLAAIDADMSLHDRIVKALEGKVGKKQSHAHTSGKRIAKNDNAARH